MTDLIARLNEALDGVRGDFSRTDAGYAVMAAFAPELDRLRTEVEVFRAELEDAKAAEKRARALAEEMRGYCAPHLNWWADRLDVALDGPESNGDDDA